MSTLKVNKLRDTSGSTDAITLDPNGGAVLAGVTTISTARITTGITTSIQVGGGVTITESGIEASGIGITCANLNGGQFGRRNKVINGAMQIAQRSTSVASITSGDYYVCDRWKLGYGTAGTWTLSQSTDTPDNFGKSLKMDCTAANTSLSVGSNLQLIQYFEGQDLQDVAKGTSSAKEITVSFYVKTNKTGTYVVELMDHDNSNRHCSKSYTVSDTNWNRYTLTFPADTTGTLDDDANKSFEVGFWLVAGSTFQGGSLQTSWGTLNQGSRAVGQVNLADSTSNEWYLTGVQLEVGSQATAFEYHSFGEELALCQRYYETSYPTGYSAGHNFNDVYPFNTSKPISQNYIASDDTTTAISYPLMVNKRANPTVTIYSAKDGTSGQAWTYKGTGGTNANDALNVIQTREQSMMLGCSLGAVNQASEKYFHYTADSEL